MSFARTYTAEKNFLKAKIIAVEADISKGLNAFSVVGLPDKAVEESRDRVSAAVKNCGFKSPKQKNQKTIVSLAPADLKKEGPAFDLAIALAYLMAMERIKFDPKDKLFLGELSLDGELRKITGVLALIQEAKERGFIEVYLPKENVREAALIEGIAVYGAKNLKEVICHLDKDAWEEPQKGIIKKICSGKESCLVPSPKTEIEYVNEEALIDFRDVKGQTDAKRGLEIAAAGGHNIAMYGPAGTGKTMLAKAFCGILPPLSFEEILEITAIHSVAGILRGDLLSSPPIRSPHHTSSYVSLVGGGANPRPGEITLAHRGVLFLDEFPEFERRVIETLRQPLEDRVISVSRAKGTTEFPANFILITAMNPCPCGNKGVKGKECICSPINLLKYERKLSGPIIDRIDMWVEVPAVEHKKLSDDTEEGESSAEIKKKVIKARKIQEERFRKAGKKIKTNCEMGSKDLLKLAPLSEKCKDFLNMSAAKLNLSARAYHRVIKLARTIADLYESPEITQDHLGEAIRYRPRKDENTEY